MALSTTDLALTRPVRRFGRPPAPALTAVGVVVGAMFVLPIAFLVVNGGGALEVWRDGDVATPLLRTLLLAATCAVTTAVLGTGLAWCIARTDLPGRRVLRFLAPLPLVFPSFVGAFCFVGAFATGGLVDRWILAPLGVETQVEVRGFWWSVVVLTAFTYPYVYLPVVARLAALPASVEESARALGCSARRLFVAVVLPQIAGAIAAGSLLVFLYSLSEFGAVSLLRYGTLTRSIYLATQSADDETGFALSLVLVGCAIAVVLSERAWARRRVRTEGATRGRVAIRYSLGRVRWVAASGVIGVLTVALFGPLLVLVQWTLRGIDHGSQLHAERLLPAMLNTARFGAIGALVAVVVTLPVAYLSVRHPGSVVGRVAGGVITSTFAFPALVLGFVFVNLAQSDAVPVWLYQSAPLLIVAYVAHFGAQALRASEVAVAGVPRRIGDAARALGASPIARLVRIELPLMRSGLAAGAGLVLLSIAKELPATLLLIPSETDTLAIRVWAATESGFYGQAGFFALFLVLLSGVLTWLITIRPLVREGRL